MKIHELPLNNIEKEMLAFLAKPKMIKHLAAKFNISYLTAQRKLMVWSAKDPPWINVKNASHNRKIYELNQKVIEL